MASSYSLDLALVAPISLSNFKHAMVAPLSKVFLQQLSGPSLFYFTWYICVFVSLRGGGGGGGWKSSDRGLIVFIFIFVFVFFFSIFIFVFAFVFIFVFAFVFIFVFAFFFFVFVIPVNKLSTCCHFTEGLKEANTLCSIRHFLFRPLFHQPLPPPSPSSSSATSSSSSPLDPKLLMSLLAQHPYCTGPLHPIAIDIGGPFATSSPSISLTTSPILWPSPSSPSRPSPLYPSMPLQLHFPICFPSNIALMHRSLSTFCSIRRSLRPHLLPLISANTVSNVLFKGSDPYVISRNPKYLKYLTISAQTSPKPSGTPAFKPHLYLFL
ncbi:hypothetical protein CRG98_015016 [Punica granatum]|uniref:Uncharacterized protein n=1 Tax=Punica granatum TaxID=22663 RepID=A0A2I0K7R0_PUNGR|nr:hypothetical protein CRG98_015016 [Punica granatum]